MALQHERVTLLTSAGGAATAYTVRPISGILAGLYVTVGTLAATTDIVVTAEPAGTAVLTITNLAASDWYKPQIPTHTPAGTASLYAAGGTAVLAPMPVNGSLKFVVAQGGATFTGYVDVYSFKEG